MKTRIALAAGLLLTVGTAVAGTLMYGKGKQVAAPVTISATDAVTPEMFAMWQSTADTDNYLAPKVPI